MPPDVPARTRGQKGRMEAAERGIVLGNGPSGGITSNGKAVTITGLPGKMDATAVKDWLRSFKLAGNEENAKEIVQIEL